MHSWCSFVFKARVEELSGIVPIAKLPKQRFNSMFKPGTASSDPYFAEFLGHCKNHCHALEQGPAFQNCQYLVSVKRLLLTHILPVSPTNMY